MKKLSFLLLLLVSLNIFSQQFEEVNYKLDIPQGWFMEQINFPINFAPELPYKGVEDIRFPPGWAKAGHENNWSYAFLWYLTGGIKIDTLSLNRDMKIYYKGLIASNGRTIPAEKIIPVETAFKEILVDKGDDKTFMGTIKMTDYMTQKPIVLNCKVHLRSCKDDNKTCAFFELSPKSTSDPVWKNLNDLWRNFKCKK